MMLGLGVGGVAVGMFHLITHAFFKALLFLGAGSVIHGCHEEQDIRRMGGLRKLHACDFRDLRCRHAGVVRLPAVLLRVLEQGRDPPLRAWLECLPAPFYLGVLGAFLTAFYMTRQVCYVFFGNRRDQVPVESPRAPEEFCIIPDPHESPSTMTAPLGILAVFAVVLGFINTPAWPWFTSFLESEHGCLNKYRLEPHRRFCPLRRSRLAAPDAAVVADCARWTRARVVVLRTQADHPRHRSRRAGAACPTDLSHTPASALRR